MEIIPVIDLLNGNVVQARHGDRQHYPPIRSSLCKGSEPLAIVQALLELYPFKQLYIADIDAIQKRGNHRQIISEIRARYPHLQIWLDAGIGSVEDLNAWNGLAVTWVIGSESLHTMDDYTNLMRQCGENHTEENYGEENNSEANHGEANNSEEDHILSLDFTVAGYQGPAELLSVSAQWPARVIAMTLGHVGSNLGPDFQLLAELVNRKAPHKIYAAGGVRHMADIQQLCENGVDGALIASALHTQQINAAELNRILSPDA
jgi:phosphoribosylformimino-5-aminoimidazole carboxamide ribotide isomerase